MKRILIIWVGLVFLVGIFVIAGEPALMAQTIELKFAHFMSPMHIQHQKSFQPFCDKVADLTGGRVKIKIYPGGALGRPTQLPDAAKTGVTDIAFIIPSYTTGRFPRLSALDLPFLVESAEHATRVVYDLYDRYFFEDFKDYKVLWLYSCGTGQLHSVTKPIYKADDLVGMKMRTPSAYMTKALTLCGANPVGMPISKLQMSLQKHVIDGMLTPYSAVIDFRLWDLVKYITQVDMYVSPMAVVMNEKSWNELPEFAKNAIDQASGRQWGLHAARVYDEHDNNTVNQNKELKKIEIYKPPASEIERLKEKVTVMEADWISEMAEKGFPAKEISQAIHASAKRNR